MEVNNDQAMNPILSFEEVAFSYQDAPVLQDVTIHVNQGEFIGIFGPNGGGKTTFLKLIMGFLKPISGKIAVFSKKPIQVQKKMAYVPQTLRFDRDFPISVEEVVLSGKLSTLPWYGKYPKETEEAAEAMIAKLGLKNFKNKALGTLSGGQIQRALIARALISEPDLLLLDEPTASVDPDAEHEIYGFLKELEGKKTILMVTHHLRTAIDLVERVLLVRKNIISLKPEEVCEHFAIGLYHPPLVKKIEN